ncbi:hypothetical protein GXP67_19735 [Rhodocytophaga rosea]|uniref:Uncharacterized protein n=1 Tax=Rhodocytophaga rosea TaxID=2704465 RepID=A0A6C0GKZ5_9BACT|nr:hypothetical protein [Rhodocytophaga rosea]QHT68716.1 hypothetical protein GXP67_19735 [Rhodocytophaga rosea]
MKDNSIEMIINGKAIRVTPEDCANIMCNKLIKGRIQQERVRKIDDVIKSWENPNSSDEKMK